MPESIPLFPDDASVEQFQAFADVQKQISEHLLAQKKIYGDIGRINRDIEARVNQRRDFEGSMLKELRAQILVYNEQQKAIVGTDLQKRKNALALRAGTEAEIKRLKDQITLMREANSIEIDMAKKQHDEDTKWFKFASTQMNNVFGLKVQEFEVTKDIGEQLIKNGMQSEMAAYFLGATLMMLKSAFTLFKKLDTAAWDFRKAMGMTRNESKTIRKDAESIAIEYMGIGVQVEEVYKAYQSIGKAVGGVHNVTKDMARDVAIISAQLGVSAEVSTAFMRNLAAVSRSSMESQANMAGLAQALSSAAGVQLGEVMQDVASRSGTTLTMMSRIPNIALRSAIELRRMGTSLDQASKSSRHILDFTENVNEEMEASVLLGRSVNLQRARELAYRRDLEGSTKEILRLTKSVNFENLDVFQQEAFAKATGKSVDELLKMVQADRQLEQIKRRGTPEQLKELALYEAMRKENDKAARARAKDNMVMIRTLANQQRLVQIQNKWNELLAQAQQWLLPVIDGMLDLVIPTMKIGMAIAQWSFALAGPFALMAKIGQLIYRVGHGMNMVVATGFKLSRFFGGMANIGLKLQAPWKAISAIFGGVLGKLGFVGKFLGFFGKLLGPIGWVITAFQAIGGFIKGWNSTTGSWLKKLGGGLMGVLRAIIPGFDFFAKMFKGLFGGIWRFLKGAAEMWWTGVKWYFTKLPVIVWSAIKGLAKMWWAGFKMYIEMWKGLGKIAWDVIKWIGKVAWEGVKSYFALWKHVGQYVWETIKGAGKLAWEGIKAYFNLWKTLGNVVYDGAKYLGNQIAKGIKAAKDGVTDAITYPFRKSWSLVSKLWGGHSPSQVGLSILQGISSVGPDLSERLLAPFRKGFSWIMNKIPGLGKMASAIRSGYEGFKGSVEKRAQASYIPAVTVTPEGTKMAKPWESTAKAKSDEKSSAIMSEETGKQIVSLLEKILNKDSSIHMDGQLLSTQLARQTEFRGGYGVNKVA